MAFSQMPKLLHVANEELMVHLRQWTFYLSLVGLPLVFAALGALPRLQTFAGETPLGSVETILTEAEEITVPTGYVDDAGIIEAPAAHHDKFQPFIDEITAAAALERGEIESYYVIDADYLQTGAVIQYSDNPQLLAETDAPVRELLNEMLLESLADPNLAARLVQPVTLIRNGPPPPTFRFIPAGVEVKQLISAGAVAALFAYVMSIGGNLLLRALQREVRARVLEMLVVSTTPAQFIGGKLLGLATLTLGQATLTLLAGLLVYGQNPDGSGPAALPLQMLVLSMPYLLLGFLAYCGLVMGIAAVWPAFSESGPLLLLLRLLVLSPLIGGLFILPDAGGPVSVGLTLFPMTSPLLMPFRLLLAGVPMWQWGLGVSFLIAWAGLWLWLSIRLFRAHGLLTGRPVNLTTLRQALLD
jgi:ABC-2 type transport system permease protein